MILLLAPSPRHPPSPHPPSRIPAPTSAYSRLAVKRQRPRRRETEGQPGGLGETGWLGSNDQGQIYRLSAGWKHSHLQAHAHTHTCTRLRILFTPCRHKSIIHLKMTLFFFSLSLFRPVAPGSSARPDQWGCFF